MKTYLIAHIGHTHRDCEHVWFWKPNSCGYTACIDEAGRYTEDEVKSICQFSNCIAVEPRLVEPLARSTPYYRKPDGTLGRLYDGGELRPVPNDVASWRALMQNKFSCSRTTGRPTPISPKKARAIYLPTKQTEWGGDEARH